MRLINIEEIVQKMGEAPRPWDKNDLMWEISQAPTIDAVPVVRCSECERRDKGFVSEKGTISCPYMEAFMPADGFCSYGERKDGEG